jgi:signal transduction histidine kinase
MLDLARLGAAGSRDFDIQVQQIGPLIERTVQGLGGMPESSRIRLDIGPDLPEVPLDAQKMQQALIDVLSNAIKYSPKGGPIVVRAQPARRQGADAVAISVIDQGIGMTPSQKARMFEPFYRAKQLQHAEGTGLGMAIVKEIIELHSGTVEIESALEAGTEVTMYLPLTNAAVAGSAAAILSPAATAEPLLSMTPIAPVAPAVPGTATLAVRN